MSADSETDAGVAELADVPGFRTGAAGSGLKPEGPGGVRETDVGVVLCESKDGTGAAVISHGAVYSPSARASSARAASGHVRAVVVNAAVANCCTGDEGLAHAREIIRLAAERLVLPQEQVILASAGAIGVPFPMDRVREGIEAACRDALENGRGDVAAAVVPRGGARRVASSSGSLKGKPFRIAGVTRGVSWEAPGAPSVLSVMATDAALRPEFLDSILRDVASRTFERLDFDRGTTGGDTVCLLASGLAGNAPLEDMYSAGEFAEALEAVAKRLALDLAFGGEDEGESVEGARLVEVVVTGAATEADADLVARGITGSASVRMALHRGEPCWGLVLAAAGRLGARVAESRATVRMDGVTVSERGRPAEAADEVKDALAAGKIVIELDLGLGEGEAALWTSDLSDGERQRVRRMEAERDSAVDGRSEAQRNLREAEAARVAAERELKSARVSLELAERGKDGLKAAKSEMEELKEKVKQLEAEKAAAAKEMKKLRVEVEIAERKASKAAKKSGSKDK